MTKLLVNHNLLEYRGFADVIFQILCRMNCYYVYCNVNIKTKGIRFPFIAVLVASML